MAKIERGGTKKTPKASIPKESVKMPIKGTWSLLLADTDKLACLKELIDILSGYTPLSGGLQTKDHELYLNVFKNLVQTPLLDGDPRSTAVLKPSTEATNIKNIMRNISPLVISEACYFFALYYVNWNLNKECKDASCTNRTAVVQNANLFIYDLVTLRLTQGSTTFNEQKSTDINSIFPEEIVIDTQEKLAWFQSIFKTGKVFKEFGSQDGTIIQLIRELIAKSFTVSQYKRDLSSVIISFLEAFDLVKRKELSQETLFLYQALTGKDSMLTNRMYAVGDGSTTKGLLNKEKFCLNLFNYQFVPDTTYLVRASHRLTSPDEDVIVFSGKIENQIIHFRSFGFDQPVMSTLDVKVNNTVKIYNLHFEGSVATNASLRPIRSQNDLGGYYTDKADYNAYTDVNKEYNDRTDFFDSVTNIKIATYFNRSENLVLYNFLGRVEFEFISSKLESDLYLKDEVQLMINVVNDFHVVEDFPIEASDFFEANKFEISRSKVDALLTEDQCRAIIYKLKESDTKIVVNKLQGEFVGRISDGNHIPDPTFIPIPTFNGETIPLDQDQANLRYSQANISFLSDTVIFEISSLTSNGVSHLRDKMETTTQKNLLDLYKKNYRSDGVVSYNQALGSLRSLGLLEALCLKIYHVSDNDPDILQKIVSVLYPGGTTSPFISSLDKSLEVRGYSSTEAAPYQISPIGYDVYTKLKWLDTGETRSASGTYYNNFPGITIP